MRESLVELRERYDRGTLGRDEYWLAAQKVYRRLRECSPIPADGAVRAIHHDGGDLVIELRDGLRMLWDPDDLRTAPNMLLNHGVYEQREMAVLAAIAKRSEVVFDVGANVGWYTLNIARAIAPRGGHVYAFEPIPRTFDVLQRNVVLNGLSESTTLLPLGLADNTGEVEFFLPSVTGSVAASQRPLFEEQNNERVRARIARLDDVVAALRIRRLDLLKCDIEGGELPMLRGGVQTIRRFRPALFLELLRKWSRAYGYHPNEVIGLLGAEGYECHAIAEQGLEKISEIDESCHSTNFLFLQP